MGMTQGDWERDSTFDGWGPAFDVREIVFVEGASSEIEDFPWSGTPGAAQVLPEILDALQGLSSAEDGPLFECVERIRYLTCSDGITRIFGAYVVASLIRFADANRSVARASVLQLVGDLARLDSARIPNREVFLQVTFPFAVFDQSGYLANWSVEAVRMMIGRNRGRLVAGLDDADPAVRKTASYVIAACLPADGIISEIIKARLETEADAVVQMSLVIAAAQHDRECGRIDESTAWVQSLWSNSEAPAGVRVGAAFAWLGLSGDDAPRPLQMLLAELPAPVTYRLVAQLPWVRFAAQTGAMFNWWRGFVGAARGEQMVRPPSSDVDHF
ncbi:hypothetical protein ACTOB_002686 [Actinoplanes oblitus]|uniref:HEAT repeat domain-containing protein n=1 Tax=Actinoplanes oblitus TaxID=3040509 RepID=A0ABY8WN27_9ACTN|nr:hypothetical protein [Actinoplanes oblitus]WIM99053.1 hypothetical protein ACTOB_002686 [Actinoplanes oblitus]